MNRRKYIYALLIATIVASSGVLVAAAVNGITLQWTKHFWVKEPQVSIECEIEIVGPKVVGYPVDINVTLRTKDLVDSVSGNLTVDLYWYNWTCNKWGGWYHGYSWNKWPADNWQYVDTLLEETNVTITGEGKTWTCTYTPELTGLYEVVVTFTTEMGKVTFIAEG